MTFFHMNTLLRLVLIVKHFIISLLIGFTLVSYSQEVTQTIRGTVADSETNFPLVGAKNISSLIEWHSHNEQYSHQTDMA